MTVTLHGKSSGRAVGHVTGQARSGVSVGLISKSKRESQGRLGEHDDGMEKDEVERKGRREDLIKGMTYTIENKPSQKPKPLQQSRVTGR